MSVGKLSVWTGARRGADVGTKSDNGAAFGCQACSVDAAVCAPIVLMSTTPIIGLWSASAPAHSTIAQAVTKAWLESTSMAMQQVRARTDPRIEMPKSHIM